MTRVIRLITTCVNHRYFPRSPPRAHFREISPGKQVLHVTTPLVLRLLAPLPLDALTTAGRERGGGSVGPVTTTWKWFYLDLPPPKSPPLPPPPLFWGKSWRVSFREGWSRDNASEYLRGVQLRWRFNTRHRIFWFASTTWPGGSLQRIITNIYLL